MYIKERISSGLRTETIRRNTTEISKTLYPNLTQKTLLPLGPNVREDLRKEQANQAEKRSRAKVLCKSSNRVRCVPALRDFEKSCATLARRKFEPWQAPTWSSKKKKEKMRSSRPWRIFRTSSREKWIADLSVDRVPRTSRGVDVLIFQNATPWETLQESCPRTFLLCSVMQSTYTPCRDKKSGTARKIIKFLFVKRTISKSFLCTFCFCQRV